MNPEPNPDNGYLADHVDRLCESYERLLGRPLITHPGTGAARAAAIYTAEFAVLSSGLEDDPLFNYANETALRLFELDWAHLVTTPARESAETELQAKREALMQQVRSRGYIEEYSGVRVSAGGRRFVIEHATVWNVVDTAGRLHGQAATFRQWRDL